MTDRERLRELAAEMIERRGHRWRLRRSTFGRQYAYVEWDKPSQGLGTGTLDREDAQYIAAASPDVILALLADLAAAEERVRAAWVEGWMQGAGQMTTWPPEALHSEAVRQYERRVALGAAQEKGT